MFLFNSKRINCISTDIDKTINRLATLTSDNYNLGSGNRMGMNEVSFFPSFFPITKSLHDNNMIEPKY